MQNSCQFSVLTTNELNVSGSYGTCFSLTAYFPKSTVPINNKITPVHQVDNKYMQFKWKHLFVIDSVMSTME
jgi:hypothetical protein